MATIEIDKDFLDWFEKSKPEWAEWENIFVDISRCHCLVHRLTTKEGIKHEALLDEYDFNIPQTVSFWVSDCRDRIEGYGNE